MMLKAESYNATILVDIDRFCDDCRGHLVWLTQHECGAWVEVHPCAPDCPEPLAFCEACVDRGMTLSDAGHGPFFHPHGDPPDWFYDRWEQQEAVHP